MKTLTCITCPNGCKIACEQDADGAWRFTGNRCGRGAEYAQRELTAPTRSVTTTVRTVYPEVPVISVRTKGEVPKACVFPVIHALRTVTIDRPVGVGDVIVPDILHTGVDVICTTDILPETVSKATH